jgi:hypothetical protein
MSVPYAVAHQLGKAFYRKRVLEGASFTVGPGDAAGRAVSFAAKLPTGTITAKRAR